MRSPRSRTAMAIRSTLIGLIGTVTAATVAIMVIALARPDESIRALRWWLVIVGIVTLFSGVSVMLKAQPVTIHESVRLPGRRRTARPEPTERLAQIDRMVTSSQWSVREYRARLRPVLLEIARHRLRSATGIDLDQEPERARAILGDQTWIALTTPINAPGADAAGFDRTQIAAIVATLEDLDGRPSSRHF
ncbi:MAG TPA: hypothetical protein PK691_01175 [Thermomicrobiales bacterium]|nr:hypothetical protein [Thermomicrobiales bacterium]